ncbi:hypothetical protein RA19_07255 [Leisingera sp. ANG-M1]|uniref:ATP-binding protein n=1 Tax=Leisingera sp. ANG-M1 TaxID=1577895 RepID=UPI00057CB18D|nr:DUF4143 domain-containing protein [Leisingera sp. ANG-M1]KIC11149.1 hypothetical protein RA19_07255 [Leisingera sp. ANG-M1]
MLAQSIVQTYPHGFIKISGSELCDLEESSIEQMHQGRALIVDMIQIQHTQKVTDVVRKSQEQPRPEQKFVLIANDIQSERAIEGSMIGITSDIELPPIQLMEHFSESKPLHTAQGPSSSASPQAQPTNSSAWDHTELWLRGGLPESLQADGDNASFEWRQDYLAALLARDYRCWGVDASDRLPDVFQWIANNNGEQFDDANCANKLSVKKDSIRRSLDVLVRIGLIRHLPNWPAKSNESLNSMPVYYVRDSGLLHAALGIITKRQLLDHKAIGHSWESFAIEAIVNAAGKGVTPAIYRDDKKNEIDLVLTDFDSNTTAIEFKTNINKGPKKGFHEGCDRIKATTRLVVHSGMADENGHDVPRLSLISALKKLTSLGSAKGS